MIRKIDRLARIMRRGFDRPHADEGSQPAVLVGPIVKGIQEEDAKMIGRSPFVAMVVMPGRPVSNCRRIAVHDIAMLSADIVGVSARVQ